MTQCFDGGQCGLGGYCDRCPLMEGCTMEIVKRIVEKRYQFEARTGLKPTCVYLGRTEHDELKRWLRKSGQLSAYMETLEGKDRSKVDGLDLYRVDADRHVGIG